MRVFLNLNLSLSYAVPTVTQGQGGTILPTAPETQNKGVTFIFCQAGPCEGL